MKTCLKEIEAGSLFEEIRYSTSMVISEFHITSLLKTAIILRKCVSIAIELHEVNENGEWQKSVKKC